MVIGITSGVFDLFHEGHMKFLYECGKKCTFLIVGVDTDKLVKLKKGNNRPVNNLDIRLKNLISYSSCNVFIKINSIENYLFEGIHYYFIPANKIISLQREEFLKKMNILVIRIPYSECTSTTKIIGNKLSIS